MISWIQKYFQRHFRLIFSVLLGMIIVAFVFTIGPSGLNQVEGGATDRPFFNYNLASREHQERLMGDASISASLQLGNMSQIGSEEVQEYAFQRGAAIHLANELRIPEATEAEKKDYIRGLRAFMGPDGQFDAMAYEQFRTSLAANPAANGNDISRVINDDVRAQKVRRLLGGPGYVLPADVKLQLERAETNWTLAIATIDYASFKPEIKPSETDLTKFFEENSGRYVIPPRVVASYVGFPAAAYLPQVTVTDAEVRAHYDANPARFPKPAAAGAAPVPSILPQDAAADFAAVRPQVERSLQLERAQRLAVKAASDFVYALWEAKIPQGPALDTFLASRNLTPTPLQPFTRDDGPAELGGSKEVADAAFRLDDNRYYTDAIANPNGAIVVFRKETQDSRTPLFLEVRDKVAADYVENEKRRLFVDLGKTIRSQLEARIKTGEPFDKAVATLSSTHGVKITAKTPPAFTTRNQPQDLDNSVLGILRQLEQGQLSEMALGPDNGILVYAIDKKLPDLSPANPQYDPLRTQLASSFASVTSRELLSEVVAKELKKTAPEVQ
jgi:peptidyl-prolyl cis-trans isomerase D